MKKPILVVLFSTVLALIVIVTQFVMAIHRGGASARTTVDLNSPVSEAKLAAFDHHLRENADAKCVKSEAGGVCLRWNFDDRVGVRVWEKDEEYAVIVSSMPRDILIFGPPRFTRIHKRVEKSVLDFWNGEIIDVGHVLR
ncbi:hypothetical protein [Aliiroseovarius sp. PrR006]|uniref:hypothetical protein n=1 Tax=Aliiroseovarius sp. PrR006 TaxID=2706883 RepID=UPI0013D14015|nr:hypothetical protein [Aliiroseovarius sp. PrR006]NDW53733.1 hypothetical protein [Aliiroseovarius sp. PrR006]